MTRTAIEDALYTWVSGASGIAVTWSLDGPAPAGLVPYIAMRLSGIQQVGHDWVDVVDAPYTFADQTVTADATANTLTRVAHGHVTGDGPVRLTTTGTLPAPLALATDYFVIRIDANTIKLASSLALALAGTAIDLADAGTGVHTLADTAATVHAGAEVEYRVRGQRRASLTLQAFNGAATGDTSPAWLLDTVIAKARLPSVRQALNAAGVGIASFGPVQSIDGVLGSADFEPRATLAVSLHLTAEVSEFSTFIERIQMQGEAPLDGIAEFEVEV